MTQEEMDCPFKGLNSFETVWTKEAYLHKAIYLQLSHASYLLDIII